jgi:hypothetical protein
MSHTRYSSGSAVRNAERTAKRCGWCGHDDCEDDGCRRALEAEARLSPAEFLRWLEV